MEHRIVVAGYERAHAAEVAAAFEVFSAADFYLREAGRPQRYRVELRTADGAPFASHGGLVMQPTGALRDTRGQVGTLLVAGTFGLPPEDERFLAGVRSVADRAERLVALCTGAFCLGRLGELDGRRVTTHWLYGSELQARTPEAQVDADAIFVRDGRVSTSAGGMAAIDLLLALVEDDVGRDIALSCARGLVLFLQRTGSQAQFSAQLLGQLAASDPLRELQQRIADDPGGDHSVETLAARLHMSPRNFSRVFTREVGMTPGRYVERVRLDAARRLLSETDLPVEAIASELRLSAATLRRLFVTRLGVSPTGYRERFRSTPGPFHIRLAS
jgi:transcriptional regulator GlxA family with amidase domain